jgi:hypothetical protein
LSHYVDQLQQRVDLVARNGGRSGVEFLDDLAAPPLLDEGLQHGLAVVGRRSARAIAAKARALAADVGAL